ncbi:MAG: hypothetical protein WEB94_01110 [Candidatus Paceibacterota bacterium]
MKNVLSLYKKEGETPLECMDRFREDNPSYQNVAMTYAGRLDPLACGILLVLADDMVHQKEEYCACDKEYYVEALLGFDTDTYDLLGVPQTPTLALPLEGGGDFSSFLDKTLKSLVSRKEQPYPPYSSRTVEGKPLWQWAREGRLDEIDIPTKHIEIYDIFDIEMSEITPEEIWLRVDTMTDLVKGDFRQGEIKEKWHNLTSSLYAQGRRNILVSFRVKCSSGTYIRTLVHELGKKIGTGACIYRLERTSVITPKTH